MKRLFWAAATAFLATSCATGAQASSSHKHVVHHASRHETHKWEPSHHSEARHHDDHKPMSHHHETRHYDTHYAKTHHYEAHHSKAHHAEPHHYERRHNETHHYERHHYDTHRHETYHRYHPIYHPPKPRPGIQADGRYVLPGGMATVCTGGTPPPCH